MMKGFLHKILVFCGVLMVVSPILDYGYSALLMRSNERRFAAWYDLMHGQIEADVVVNGSSRAWVHISPQILDSVLGCNSYNLGMNGSNIDRQIRKFRLYEKYNKRPKVVIQTIDCFSLDKTNGFEREQFFPYFLNVDMRREFYETEPISFLEKYLPLYRYRGVLKWEYLSQKTPSLEKGYRGQDMVWDGSVYEQIDSITFTYSDEVVRMFDDYLRDMRRKGIRVVFVYTPIYIGATRKLTNEDEMWRVYRRIAGKYDIPVLDFSHTEMCSDTTLFYNAMHLNRRGAEMFSRMLGRDLSWQFFLKERRLSRTMGTVGLRAALTGISGKATRNIPEADVGE